DRVADFQDTTRRPSEGGPPVRYFGLRVKQQQRNRLVSEERSILSTSRILPDKRAFGRECSRAASKTNPRVGLSAAVGSVVLFAAALLAGLRFRRRLVVPLVEFDRAVRFQHFTIDALELRLGKGRCRFARTALVGVLRQRLAALEVEVIGRAIDRH